MPDPPSTRLARAEAVFFAALERPAAERSDLVAARCAGDRELRDLVEHLLRSDATADRFLEGTALGPGFSLPAPDRLAEPGEPRRLGPWELLRLLGSGGIGHVWLARRVDEHFHKLAAVKVLKRGMDTDAILLAFRQERQLLARLDHPNIARLLDGGATDDGRPYLVMDYVDGEPLHDHVRRHRLAVEARLRLFREVCDAVAHAHRNLIVHRDLKPGNILVARDGRPRLLDFGIAKVLDPDRAAPVPSATRSGLLTPEYASPEQLRGEPVTTASDVYSLGVVLYELLSGSLPWEHDTTRTGGQTRRDPDGQVPRPSQHVLEAAAGGDPAARAALARKLRGDLDTIVDVAMRPAPDERYASADALSEDVRRYLQRLPIRAKPTSRWYVARRFVQRHRWSTAFAAAALAILVGALGEAQRARRQAEAGQDAARREAAKLRAVNGFLEELLVGEDPVLLRGDLTLRQMLEDAARSLEAGRLAGQPELEAAVRTTIGRAYTVLRMPALGEPHLLRARALYDGLGQAETVPACETLAQLALCVSEQARLAEGSALHRQALELLTRLDPDNAELRMRRLWTFSTVLRDQRRGAEAATVAREALVLALRLFGPEHRDTAESRYRLGWILLEAGRHAEAETELSEALRVNAQLLGATHPTTAEATLRLGMAMVGLGRQEEGERLMTDAIGQLAARVGEDHLRTCRAMSQLARVLERRQAFDQAEAWFRRCYEARRSSRDHFRVLLDWAATRVHRGDLAGAEDLLRRFLADPVPLDLAVGPALWARAHATLSEVLRDGGRFAEAEQVLLAGEAALEVEGQSPAAADLLERRLQLYERWARDDPEVDLGPRRDEARRRLQALRPGS